MSTGKQKHLPLLYNPLLNAIFNNPHHAKAAIRSTIAELSNNHNDYTILVPPAQLLREGFELGGHKLEDLCYENDAFLKSHIIKTSSPFSTTMAPVTKVQLIIYNTMNGKQVLVKNGMVFTGKGFKKSIRANILSTDYFTTFCEYFPKGSKVMLLYIDDSLYGHKLPEKDVQTASPQPELKKDPRPQRTVTFEELLRNFPLLSKAMSDHFYMLFHHNNRKFERLRVRSGVSLKETKALFMAMVEEAFSIVQKTISAETADGERISRLLHNVTSQNSTIDLNHLVHEYVELNMYDKVWVQIVSQFEKAAKGDTGGDLPEMVLSPAVYKDLSCLSLNQLDIPVDEPWHMNVLHARVAAAIAEFSKLNDPGVTNRRQKIDLLKKTVDILSDGTSDKEKHDVSHLVVDADTLIGLLIMVVVHSKVPYLDAHIYYIRNFGVDSLLTGNADPEKSSAGYLNYVLSNIDAVIFHLSGQGLDNNPLNHLQEMSTASAQNYNLWYAIQNENIKNLERMMDLVREQYGDGPLPKDHFLRSRNIHGESCLTFALRTKNSKVFKTVLDKTLPWTLVEDLLFDKNTSTDQTLMMIALVEENSESANYLLDALFESSNEEEKILYLNLRDNNGRTIGHYLSHDLDILAKIGLLIDWHVKDNNSHTPLFSICRHYDHPRYIELIKRAFGCVFTKYEKPIALDQHTDKYGNTFLHILAKGLSESGILDPELALLNVNQPNDRLLTPLAVYVRYGRTDNLRYLMKNKLFDFSIEDQQNFYNLLDYYSFSAAKAKNGSNKSFKEIERLIVDKYFETNFSYNNDIETGVLNARYDGSASDWIINMVFYTDEAEPSITTKYIPIDRVRQFTKLQKLAFPQGFGLDVNSLWINHPSDKPTIPACSKYRSNRLLELLTMYFLAMHFHSQSSKTKFKRNLALCCDDNGNSTLEMIKDINNAQEEAKARNGIVKFSPQKVQEIEYFLEYSQSDLRSFHLEVRKLNQLLTVAGMKQSDVRNVSDIFLRRLDQGKSVLLDRREFRLLDSSYMKLQAYANWLELSVEQLLQNCKKLQEKLRWWKQIYQGIKDINAELHRFEEQFPKQPQNGDAREENESGIFTNTMARRSTTLLDKVPEDISENSSFFNFGIIDSKKSRYKKLLLAKAEEVKKVMNLNADIKIDHELIAAEISQFMSFRSGFFSLGIKHFCEYHLLLLRTRNQELERLLWSIRRAE